MSGSAVAGSLVVLLQMRSDQFTASAKKHKHEMTQLQEQAHSVQHAVMSMFSGFTAGVILEKTLHSLVHASSEWEVQLTRLQSVLTATGEAAGLSQHEIVEFAEGLEHTTRFSRAANVQAAGLLATFTKIKGAQFKGALTAALDLSTIKGTDVAQSITLIGRALQSPADGFVRLARVGITFDAQFKEHVKSLTAFGQAAEAQQLILDELGKRFGGAAMSDAKTTAGLWDQVKNSFEEMAETWGEKLGPLIKDALDALKQLPKDFTPAAEEVDKKLEEVEKRLERIAQRKNMGWLTALMTGKFSDVAPEATKARLESQRAVYLPGENKDQLKEKLDALYQMYNGPMADRYKAAHAPQAAHLENSEATKAWRATVDKVDKEVYAEIKSLEARLARVTGGEAAANAARKVSGMALGVGGMLGNTGKNIASALGLTRDTRTDEEKRKAKQNAPEFSGFENFKSLILKHLFTDGKAANDSVWKANKKQAEEKKKLDEETAEILKSIETPQEKFNKRMEALKRAFPDLDNDERFNRGAGEAKRDFDAELKSRKPHDTSHQTASGLAYGSDAAITAEIAHSTSSGQAEIQKWKPLVDMGIKAWLDAADKGGIVEAVDDIGASLEKMERSVFWANVGGP